MMGKGRELELRAPRAKERLFSGNLDQAEGEAAGEWAWGGAEGRGGPSPGAEPGRLQGENRCRTSSTRAAGEGG